LVWEYREISRADIARRTGLSRSTVSTVMSELLDSGIVEETRQGSSNGGRRPIMVGFRDNARTVLGVDVGASHIDAVLTNLRGEILERGSRVMPTRDAPEATLDAITTMARQLIKASPAPCLGVGVGLPSPVHPSSGRVPREVLPRWSEVDVAQALFERIDRPVRIDNDANLGALAELWWGAGRGGDDLVFVKVATGIGAGLIVNGRIVRGAHGFAGEVGHLSSDPNGPPCICGVNGCLNVIMGTEALLERARLRHPHFPTTTLRADDLTLRDLLTGARSEDPLAREVIQFAGERLGAGLANLLNVLDPTVIVLGGDLIEAGPFLLEVVRNTALQRTIVDRSVPERIVVSQTDRQGIALGAATLILREALETFEIPLDAVQEAT
ncbi:MAG: ROK family transcriptional regulator, partial [Myxococcota bacterium]